MELSMPARKANSSPRKSGGFLNGSRIYLSGPMDFVASRGVQQRKGWRTRIGRVLEMLEGELSIRPNERGIPSLWYTPLVGGENFFDGFGFQLPKYRRRYGWRNTPIDELERKHPPKRPLRPLLGSLNKKLPNKWDNKLNKYVRNDDWLLWTLKRRGEIKEPYSVTEQ